MAQSTGAIAGMISDTTGGAIPGASIMATNQATGLKWSTISGGSGDYQIVALPTGPYQLEVQAPGFQTQVIKNLPVAVAQTTAQNIQLTVGQISETLTVDAAAPVVQTATMAVSQVVDQRTVQEIPLNGRHFVDLGLLLPGSVVQPQNGFLTAPLRGQGAFAFNTAGNREDTVNFMINGVNLNDMVQNQITFQPSINTVSEFKADNSTLAPNTGATAAPSSTSRRAPARTSSTAKRSSFSGTRSWTRRTSLTIPACPFLPSSATSLASPSARRSGSVPG